MTTLTAQRPALTGKSRLALIELTSAAAWPAGTGGRPDRGPRRRRVRILAALAAILPVTAMSGASADSRIRAGMSAVDDWRCISSIATMSSGDPSGMSIIVHVRRKIGSGVPQNSRIISANVRVRSMRSGGPKAGVLLEASLVQPPNTGRRVDAEVEVDPQPVAQPG